VSDKEIESWNGFQEPLRFHDRILFQKMLVEIKDSKEYQEALKNPQINRCTLHGADITATENDN